MCPVYSDSYWIKDWFPFYGLMQPLWNCYQILSQYHIVSSMYHFTSTNNARLLEDVSCDHVKANELECWTSSKTKHISSLSLFKEMLGDMAKK